MNDDHYIVLRYGRLLRSSLAGVERHGRRKGSDLDHVDDARSHRNEFLVGSADLCADVDARLAGMMRDNIERRISRLRKSRHTRHADELVAALEAAGDDVSMLAELNGWPWDHEQEKPYTEGLLSISHEWFEGEPGEWSEHRADEFRAFVADYLSDTFGPDVVYARMDMDEQTPHVHFVVLPEFEDRRTGKRMLGHHRHRHFGRNEIVPALFDGEEPDPSKVRRSYELLQNEVAEFAKARGLGVERGAKRAERNRLLEELGEAVERRDHVTPAEGRRNAKRLQAEADEARSIARDDRAAADHERATAEAERHAAAEDRADAEQERAMAAEDTAAVAAIRDGLVMGIEAVLDERLAYASGAGSDGLIWGRRKPKEPTLRDRLMAAVAPARDLVATVAKRLASVIAREKAVETREAELVDLERKLEKQEADQRRHAALLLRAGAEAGRPRDPLLAAIAGEASMPVNAEAFPDAWPIPHRADKKHVQDVLDHTTNMKLRERWGATRDAVALLADAEEQHELRSDMQRGRKVLEHEAARRGLDLDNGEHDPSRARDRFRAELHTDQRDMRVHVVRKDAQKVRSRT